MRVLFANVEALFARAERSIALLDRSRPINAAAEARRTRDLWQLGRPENPTWRYGAPPDLGSLRIQLCHAAEALDTIGGALAHLYAERARELEIEAEIAQAIGSSRAFSLARRRYPAPKDTLSKQARGWAQLPPASVPPKGVRSDLASAPDSLLGQMLKAVSRLNLPVSVVIEERLQSVAAAGQDTVFIKPGVLLAPNEARRIVLHELLGHILPRHRSRSESLGLLRVGSANGSDDEEGRALLLERRHGLMHLERQRELGQRHLAALSVLQGADWVETVRMLAELGTTPERALSIANRVHRASGLAREIVYLPALSAVERAFAVEPELEAWLEVGRVSVAAARELIREFPRTSQLTSVSGSAIALFAESHE